jgi:hypothetical protein
VVIATGRASLLALAAALTLAGCGGESQPWKGGSADDASVAPAATSVPNEPPRASTPGDAPSPGGTTPDGAVIGTTAPDESPKAAQQDRAAMLLLRTAVSIVEGCKSGRQSYADCDEQRELGARDEIGVIFSDGGVGTVKVSASPQSIRVTTRSESGARFTVARSPRGDRFSCTTGVTQGVCSPDGTWSW